jgi:alpha-beta hydrolase superfamily lysophospholipase
MSKKVFSRIFIFIIISIMNYFIIASVLILIGKPQKPFSYQNRLSFTELFIDYSELPKLQNYTARDGTLLAYRHYPAESNKVLILLHGSGWHSQYFLPLAGFIASQDIAHVYTPDLRGHGRSPQKQGDVDYIGQLENDLADFIAVIKKDNPNSMLIVGGHSSGGGLAIRFAGSRYGQQADAYLLLAPWLKYNAPTRRPETGRWARPYTLRIIGLSMLNNVGVRFFNDLTVIEFNIPKEARDGTETLSYSYRLNKSYAPRNYKKDLSAITQPLLVVVGTADKVFFADKYEPVISQYTDVQVTLLQGLTHMGVVASPKTRPVIGEWLSGLNKL